MSQSLKQSIHKITGQPSTKQRGSSPYYPSRNQSTTTTTHNPTNQPPFWLAKGHRRDTTASRKDIRFYRSDIDAILSEGNTNNNRSIIQPSDQTIQRANATHPICHLTHSIHLVAYCCTYLTSSAVSREAESERGLRSSVLSARDAMPSVNSRSPATMCKKVKSNTHQNSKYLVSHFGTCLDRYYSRRQTRGWS